LDFIAASEAVSAGRLEAVPNAKKKNKKDKPAAKGSKSRAARRPESGNAAVTVDDRHRGLQKSAAATARGRGRGAAGRGRGRGAAGSFAGLASPATTAAAADDRLTGMGGLAALPAAAAAATEMAEAEDSAAAAFNWETVAYSGQMAYYEQTAEVAPADPTPPTALTAPAAPAASASTVASKMHSIYAAQAAVYTQASESGSGKEEEEEKKEGDWTRSDDTLPAMIIQHGGSGKQEDEPAHVWRAVELHVTVGSEEQATLLVRRADTLWRAVTALLPPGCQAEAKMATSGSSLVAGRKVHHISMRSTIHGATAHDVDLAVMAMALAAAANRLLLEAGYSADASARAV